MLGTTHNQNIANPKRLVPRTEGPPVAETLRIVVEKVCSIMRADGAVIALRDRNGICCVASTGDAPPVGSRIQPDSDFTRECVETGAVMLCKDALADSRIRFSIAQVLHLRSVVAVPIQTQGSVLGLLEVFSLRPFAFDTAQADTLQAVANLLVRVVLASVQNGLLSPDISM